METVNKLHLGLLNKSPMSGLFVTNIFSWLKYHNIYVPVVYVSLGIIKYLQQLGTVYAQLSQIFFIQE